jgi:hypothetical protein
MTLDLFIQDAVDPGDIEVDSQGRAAVSNLDLKPEHQIVYSALRVAVGASGSVVTSAQCCEAVLEHERATLVATYQRPAIESVRKILSQLVARNIIYRVGQGRMACYFACEDLLPQSSAVIPTRALSSRRRVLGLLAETVAESGRAALATEVVAHANKTGYSADSPRDIVVALGSLVKTGDAVVIGTVKAGPMGSNLYLPSGLPVEEYRPQQPLTWLDWLAREVEAFWEKRRAEAEREGRRPRPFTTLEIRDRLRAMPEAEEHLQDPQTLVNDMATLAKYGSQPLLRPVDASQGGHVRLWAPNGVPNSDLDLGTAFGRDSDRIIEALRRAVASVRLPVVSSREVAQQVELDPALKLLGKSSVAYGLADLARSSGMRRRIQRVIKVGRINGVAHYALASQEGVMPLPAEALADVAGFMRLRARWDRDRPRASLEDLALGTLEILRQARAQQLLNDVLNARGTLDRIRLSVCAQACEWPEVLARIDAFSREVDEVFESVQGWLRFRRPHASLTDASQALPAATGWTVEELQEQLRPLWGTAQQMNANQLLSVLGERVRRIPNPAFDERLQGRARRGQREELFDRTDALIFAAQRWGGFTARLMASTAALELGRIRDAQLAVECLSSERTEDRLAAVACLAFEWSEEGLTHLRRRAITDTDAGVRAASLWAYGFAGGPDINSLMSEATTDQSDRVQRMLSRLARRGETGYWKL